MHAKVVQERTAEILSQGDEVLEGHTVDTNAAHVARALAQRRIRILRQVVVGDDAGLIAGALDEARGRAAEVICTGGLGPTDDDCTAEAVARAYGRPLREDPRALAQVRARYEQLGRVVPEAAARRQARIPEGARLLENARGTAPGFAVEEGSHRGWFLPGVPHEMRAMFANYVLPHLEDRHGVAPARTATVRILGLGESAIAERLRGWAPPGVRIGFRALLPENQVRLRFDPHLSPAEEASCIREVRARLGDHVFGVDCGPVEQVVGERLAQRGETVAVAESCTGGRLAAALTRTPGASAWFLEGVVAYHDAVKVRRLGVREPDLERHGAVSETVARQMARGVRDGAGSTWSVATTGVAGPSGGTDEKPVGTVHVAVAGPRGVSHRRWALTGDRGQVMARTVALALDHLRRRLEGLGPR